MQSWCMTTGAVLTLLSPTWAVALAANEELNQISSIFEYTGRRIRIG